MLTPQQAKTLHFITAYTERHDGVAPSYREIQDHLGLASKSGVHRLVCGLEERGALRRLPHRNRSLHVVKGVGFGRFCPQCGAPLEGEG